MKNPARLEVLSALRARGVSLRRLATHLDRSFQQRQKTNYWLTLQQQREEQLQVLWLLGWEWSRVRHPVSVTLGQAIGQRLMAAVEALRYRKH